MIATFICTILLYNTPVFYKISQIDDNDYFAEPKDSKLQSFTLKKRYGEWFAESQTTHSLAVQIGKQIDKIISSASPEE
jgi:hypothetical protein